MMTQEKVRRLFRQHGPLRTREVLEFGVHPKTLYHMRDEGELEQLARGVYRLADAPPLDHPELVAVAERAPRAVVCLISALALHEMTTEIPHEVHLAVRRGSARPVIQDFPIRVYTFHQEAFQTGINEYQVDNVPIRMYNPEKTLVDIFRYRNHLGLDVFLEALNFYRKRRGASPQKVLEVASVWRATKLITPYLAQAFS